MEWQELHWYQLTKKERNKEMKKITIGIILTLLLVTGCGKKSEENPNNQKESIKVNTSENVIKDQKIEVFEFTNTSLIYSEGTTRFETTVTNTSDETAYLSEFRIHVKDKEGKEVEQLVGFVGSELKSKESRIINSYSVKDLTDVDTIEYEVIR